MKTMTSCMGIMTQLATARAQLMGARNEVARLEKLLEDTIVPASDATGFVGDECECSICTARRESGRF